jgi:hypothetical protein
MKQPTMNKIVKGRGASGAWRRTRGWLQDPSYDEHTGEPSN